MIIHGVVASSKKKTAAAISALGSPTAYLLLTKNATQNITTTESNISFQTIGSQLNWPFSAGSNFTVPSGITIVSGSIILTATGAAGPIDALITLRKNGTMLLERYIDDNQWAAQNLQFSIPVAAGDVLTFGMLAYGGAYTLSTISRLALKGWNH